VSGGTERARWALQGLFVRPTATAQQYDIPVKSLLEAKVRTATSAAANLAANGSTFLETTDIQKEFYFTHDSGRVKNAQWGGGGGG